MEDREQVDLLGVGDEIPAEEQVERLSDLLQTMRNTLEEIQVQRDRERQIREMYEKDLLALKTRMVTSDTEIRELGAKVEASQTEVERANKKRRQAVEQAEGMRAELDMLKRLNRELEERLSDVPQ